MSFRRGGAVARRIIFQLRRDHRTLGLIFVVPLAVLALLGYLVRLPSSVAIGIETSGSPPEETAAQALESAPGLRVVRLAPGAGEAELQAGGIAGLVKRAPTPSGAAGVIFELTVEGSDPSKSALLLSRVPAALARSLAQLGGGAAPQVSVRYLYGGPQFDPLDYFAPALVPTFAFLFVFLLTSVSFLRERTQGTLERLMASPLSRLELVLGYMGGFGLFAVVQSAVILLFAVFVLRIHYVGNLGIVFLVQAILTVLAVNLGVLLSGFARNEFQAVQFMPMVVFPQALLAGVFWPVNDLPVVLRLVAQALPLTYANEALREVMIRGAGLQSTAVLRDLLVLTAFAGLFLALAAMTLRRRAG